jgi:enoyl-[acyl-carrier protein] reductase I
MTVELLQGKKGIITGALDESSIAWKVALRAQAAGATFILTNAPVGIRMGKIKDLAAQTGAELIPADATNLEDIEKLMDAAINQFGKIDFMLHSIGMSPNVRKNIPYTDTNYDNLIKTLDISALSFHKLMQVAWKKDIMNQWGSIVGISYIAAQRIFPKYNDMTEAKALLESITRNFGYHFGKAKKVRVNTVSQSPTPTTAGSGIAGFVEMLKFAEITSPLGNATADECADFIIMLFSDFTRKVTMQNLMHDGGFSNVGIAEEILQLLP